MEKEELSFTFENNGSLISKYQRIQNDSDNEWERQVCEAVLPQRRMAIEKLESNLLPFLKLKPWDTLLPNTMVATLFTNFFGWEM